MATHRKQLYPEGWLVTEAQGCLQVLIILIAPLLRVRGPEQFGKHTDEHLRWDGPADSLSKGEEVLHLPTIVEAAESSPAAASQAALEIRKFLSSKNYQKAYVQYNAIMLVRILADNPGKSFTRNIDAKFISTVKELLRDGRDMSVQQILRETLDTFETQKPQDETLVGIREMWTKEKTKIQKRGNMAVSNSPLPRALDISDTPPATHTPQPHRPSLQPQPTELLRPLPQIQRPPSTSRTLPTRRRSQNER